jgi:short-subunit dehydrogenase
MSEWLHDIFRGRPLWMNALMVFCAYMTFIYMPWDIFWKPVAEDHEVWFGILLTGWAAKITAPAHWFIFAAGTYGFRRMRPFMCTWGAVYAGYVAFSMFVWGIAHMGVLYGTLAGLAGGFFPGLIAFALWNSHDEHFADRRPPLSERYGPWALVTGASSGIGAEFARAFAREGVSCVLVARREERLRTLAAELEKHHQVETRVVPIDLAATGAADRLVEELGGLDINILVNNAGFGYQGRFDKLEIDRLNEMLVLHCVTPVVLTHKLLPAMLERGRGAVIVTGSVSGRQPLPLHAVYSATKSFQLLFGEALAVELRHKGVHTLVLEPGSTGTEFEQVSGSLPHGGESPVKVVQVALDALGGQPSVISGWFNWLRANLGARLGSRPLVADVAKLVMERQTPHDMR